MPLQTNGGSEAGEAVVESPQRKLHERRLKKSDKLGQGQVKTKSLLFTLSVTMIGRITAENQNFA